MIRIRRTDSSNEDFIGLVRLLDAELVIRDGREHSFYAQYNKVDSIKYVVLAFENDVPIGCGAIKEYDADTMEVKRMFVVPDGRGKGVATMILKELEKWAEELSCKKCILETGKNQPEAIALYKKAGYAIIANYGQYSGVENSVCFDKIID